MTLDWNERPEAREEFLDRHERYLRIDDSSLVDETEAAAVLIPRLSDADAVLQD